MYIEDNASMRDGAMQLRLPCSLTDFAEMLGVGRASLYRTLVRHGSGRKNHPPRTKYHNKK